MFRSRFTVGVASTFPPREDGIATFTRDLLAGVCGAQLGISARIAAITDPGSSYAYPRQVRWEIEQDDKDSYAAAARALARAKVAVVSLQHEFGLWGAPGYLAASFDAYDCAPAFLRRARPAGRHHGALGAAAAAPGHPCRCPPAL